MILDQISRRIPEYYSYMYLDGYRPEEILQAIRWKMIDNAEAAQIDDTPPAYIVRIDSNVEVKK